MNQPDPAIILHHYPMSPYSEKVRAMFGYLGTQWQSAMSTEMPPRPTLAALAGGYRKIPVAQVGADIYCDTQTITTLLANHCDKPELALENCEAAIQEFVKKVEGEIFFACVMYGAGMKLNKKVLRSMSIWHVVKFLFDRIKMGKQAVVKMPSPKRAPAIVEAYIPEVEAMLASDFLFGNTPTIADFSAYHSLWFARDMGEKPIFKDYPKVSEWMDRIKSFGHGVRTEISGEQAIATARTASPIAVPENARAHDLIGELVQVAPNDYALDPSSGVLEGCTELTYILSRESPKAGKVHVHFPRRGYQLIKSN